MVQQLRGIGNTQQLQNMLLQNPNIKPAMDLIKSVGSLQGAFTMLAHQKGFTDEDIRDIFS